MFISPYKNIKFYYNKITFIEQSTAYKQNIRAGGKEM